MDHSTCSSTCFPFKKVIFSSKRLLRFGKNHFFRLKMRQATCTFPSTERSYLPSSKQATSFQKKNTNIIQIQNWTSHLYNAVVTKTPLKQIQISISPQSIGGQTTFATLRRTKRYLQTNAIKFVLSQSVRERRDDESASIVRQHRSHSHVCHFVRSFKRDAFLAGEKIRRKMFAAKILPFTGLSSSAFPALFFCSE